MARLSLSSHGMEVRWKGRRAQEEGRHDIYLILTASFLPFDRQEPAEGENVKSRTAATSTSILRRCVGQRAARYVLVAVFVIDDLLHNAACPQVLKVYQQWHIPWKCVSCPVAQSHACETNTGAKVDRQIVDSSCLNNRLVI